MKHNTNSDKPVADAVPPVAVSTPSPVMAVPPAPPSSPKSPTMVLTSGYTEETPRKRGNFNSSNKFKN